ncbi:ABC transporter permease, partial [Treponema sp. R80B11-R83G3]
SAEGYVSAPRYTFSGTLSSTSGSAPIVFYAVEPEAEREVLRYVPYMDFGRYVQNGNFEIALGTIAAEKLKVGIPSRPYRKELEELISLSAQNIQDADFIRSLYDEAPISKNVFDPVDTRAVKGNERMMLKKNASKPDLDRYWEMIAVSGRNNVRINAVIDIKAAPEIIRADKWNGELFPALREEDKALVQSAYNLEEFMGSYILVEDDEDRLAKVLDAMIRAGFQGAVNHINQAFEVVVAGVINSPDPLPNGNTAYIPLDILQSETGMMLQGAVTELIIRERGVPDSRLPGESESSAVITIALNKGLASMGLALPNDLAVHTWQDYMAEYLGYEEIQTGAPQVLAFLLLLLSFLGISNTILLAILERTKEIGMMRAMGMTDGQMILTFMLEAGFIGIIGSVLGIIIGCVFNYPMVKYGLDFSAMSDTLSGGIGFRTTANFRSVWNIPIIIGSGVVATLLSSFVAYCPTRRALKKPITESLRFE